MLMENVVLFIIGWLLLTTFLFLFIVLRLNKVEINSSKNKLALKLSMHYSHSFHRMRVIFEKYAFHEITETDDLEKLYYNYNKNKHKIRDSVRIISDAIALNCADNQFVFVKDREIREKLTYISKNLINGFQEWIDVINDIESNDYSMEKFEQYRLKYDRLIISVIELHSILINEVYADILS